MIIIDDFVQDKRLLTKIALDNRFWAEGYHWWGGWWNEDISSIRHELITYIYRDNCPLKGNFGIQGFEHWTGVYSAGDGKVVENLGSNYHLKHHFDKDEDHWQATGEVKRPVNVNGPYELIKPKFNRLIIFDAGKLHAVQEVTKGTRKAIAINLWEVAPVSANTMLK